VSIEMMASPNQNPKYVTVLEQHVYLSLSNNCCRIMAKSLWQVTSKLPHLVMFSKNTGVLDPHHFQDLTHSDLVTRSMASVTDSPGSHCVCIVSTSLLQHFINT